MEQTVQVVSCNSDETAQVLHIRQSACSGDCHKCSGCGAAEQKMLLTARNPIGAKPGQMVTVESNGILLAAMVLYIVPLVLFVAAYLLGEHLWGRGPLLGLAGLVFGFTLTRLYDRFITKKKIVYTITGLVNEPIRGDEEN